MAVLIEGISVVVRCDSVADKYAGGWAAFIEDLPQRPFCTDGELARIGFMMPDDVKSYVEKLEHKGLKYLDNRTPVNIAVVDQRTGLCARCDWAVFGTAHVDNDRNRQISVCWAKSTRVEGVVVPDGWVFDRSLSANSQFVETGKVPASLKLRRREPNLDVYYDEETGKEFYVGRVSQRSP